MSTKRRKLQRPPRLRVTPEALKLWRTLREIEADPKGGEWEPVGRHREFLDAEKRLCTVLGLWWGDGRSPISTKRATPPGYLYDEYRIRTWREGWKWRLALLAAEAEEAGQP